MDEQLEAAILRAVALASIYYGGTDGEIEEWLDSCHRAWQGFSLTVIKHAAIYKDDEFATIAVLTLAEYDFEQWKDFCLMNLSSPNPWTRWGSAIALGRKQHPAALPLLNILLLEQSQAEELSGHVGESFFLFWAFMLPKLLRDYGELAVVPTLIQALLNVEQMYQKDPNLIPMSVMMTTEEYVVERRSVLEWPITQYEYFEKLLIDSLGGLKQWDALDSIPFSAAAHDLWQVLLVGAAVLDEVQETTQVRWFVTMEWEEIPVLAKRVSDELHQRYYWNAERIVQVMHDFERSECMPLLTGRYICPQAVEPF